MNKRPLNYIYFGFLFLLLGFAHGFHVLLIDQASETMRFLFFIQALGQCFVEALLLTWLLRTIYSRFPRWGIALSLLCFSLLVVQLIDFALVRLMDMSFWRTVASIADESWENFLEMLHASNISILNWILAGVLILLMLLFGTAFFLLTERLSAKKPLKLSSLQILKISALAIGLLCILDTQTSPKHHHPIVSACHKALPWKTTLSIEAPIAFSIPAKLKIPEPIETLPEQPLLTELPDIFLFIAESLRADFITPETAPNLAQFKSDFIAPELTLSNSNATQLSWFSIFHSRPPFSFGKVQQMAKQQGALPIRLLKKLGYQIHIYTSARLSFYQMDRVIFGQNKELADAVHYFRDDPSLRPYQSDARCIARLRGDLLANRGSSGGRVHIIFLDGTHFDYSWPERVTSPFTPYLKAVNYFKIAYSKENLEGVINRYRNAIHFLDTLFGQFVETMKMTERWDRSVVVFTADHGEEFYERGHIFHATDLSNMQTNVPIYYKLNHPAAHTGITSQLDIFPTILDDIGATLPPKGAWEGESLLRERIRPYVVAGRYNGARGSEEFFIHDGTHKLVGKFRGGRDVYSCSAIDVLQVKNREDESLSVTPEWITSHFGEAIDALMAP
jgi:glucan phosphoethanolaminetransferase (alkaline phosphatase superfamily)